MTTCLHCNRHQKTMKRGLCNPCWRDPAIRARYPKRHNGGQRVCDEDATAEEIEAIVAEQYATMDAEVDREFGKDGTDYYRRTPPTVARGRGLRSRSRRDNW